MKARTKKILVISLSNIGDIILTFPVIDVLKRDFPEARLDLVIGSKAEALVKDHPAFGKIYVFQKKQPLSKIFQWMRGLAREQYDLVVDLRNTLIPFLIFAKRTTPLMVFRPKVTHMREQHLSRLRLVYQFERPAPFGITFEKDQFALPDGKYAVVAPGSRAENKRWSEKGFARIADDLIEKYGAKILLVGDQDDVPAVRRIRGLMKNNSTDLAGKLSLSQLAYVMSKASLAVVNDSAPLHLASYFNIPVAAFFGPTDPEKYGPWSDRGIVVRKNSSCLACAGDRSRPHDCILAITYEEAIAVLGPWFKETFDGK